ncbi:MAG: trypsin-like peptidase domain-containing protein [Patescibacteria group bacterium]
MFPRIHPLFVNIGALALLGGIFFFLTRFGAEENTYVAVDPFATTSVQVAAAGAEFPAPPPPISAPSIAKPKATTTAGVAKTQERQRSAPKQAENEATRVQDPYPFPPQSVEVVNDAARSALVNILCTSQGGMVQSIAGSGIIIDPRGVILTNAHVAQYILLSQSPLINLSCTIRTGSPAVAHWIPEVLYIPPVWVEKHAQEIRMPRPMGTGEHDYALLLIAKSLDGTPLPSPASGFPHLPFDTREAIGFQDDEVLIASYPAEFIGGHAAQFNLFPVTSVASIRGLLTFAANTVDLISLGGVVEAQSGSSGGAVVNAWGRLVGLISTTSEGETTAARDLRALTLSYINRDLVAQTQFDIPIILGGDVFAQAQDFNARVAPPLVDLYIKHLSN